MDRLAEDEPAPEMVTIDLSRVPEDDREWLRGLAAEPGRVDRGQLQAARAAGGDGTIAQSARDLVQAQQETALNAELDQDPAVRARQAARRSAAQVMQQVGWSAPPARLPHPDDPDTTLPPDGNSDPAVPKGEFSGSVGPRRA